jgi:hypothetical protein
MRGGLLIGAGSSLLCLINHLFRFYLSSYSYFSYTLSLLLPRPPVLSPLSRDAVFYREDGCSRLVRNTSTQLLNYTASHITYSNIRVYRCENLTSHTDNKQQHGKCVRSA